MAKIKATKGYFKNGLPYTCFGNLKARDKRPNGVDKELTACRGIRRDTVPWRTRSAHTKGETRHGIPLAETTWDEIKRLMDEFNVGTSLTSLP